VLNESGMLLSLSFNWKKTNRDRIRAMIETTKLTTVTPIRFYYGGKFSRKRG
jgi:hypothetical protein